MSDEKPSLSQPSTASFSRFDRLGPFFVAGVVAFLVWGLYLLAEIRLLGGRLGLSLDDGWIHLQFARNLAAGDGLSFQSGEWVTASTAPLWTALLSPLFLLPGNVLFWTKLLGGALFLATVDATIRLARLLGLSRGMQVLAGLFVAMSHWLVWSSLSGMEIPLFTSLSLWACILHLREREEPGRVPLSWAFFALATLARPEGALLLAVAVVDRLWQGATIPGSLPTFLRSDAGRRFMQGVLCALVILVPTLIFFQVAGGSPLPTTFFVKTSVERDLMPSGRYLRAVLDVLFRSQPWLLLAAGAGILRLLEGYGEKRDRGFLLAGWVLGLPLAQSLMAADGGPVVVGNFGRYYFPLLPFVVVLGLFGAERGVRRLPSFLRWALLALALAPQVWGVASGMGMHARTVANVEESDVAAAQWLAERLPPEALVATQDIGAVKFFLPNRILDLAGLVNPEILPVLRGAGGEDPRRWEERLYGFLAERRPEVLVVFPKHYPNLVRQPGFRPVARFAVRDNLTMAGDELVVFATPWSETTFDVQ